MKGDKIVRPCGQRNRDSQEHVAKYKHMRQWMVESLRKFKNREIKIAGVNSIRITKSIDLLTFCTVFAFLNQPPLRSPLTVKSMMEQNRKLSLPIANDSRGFSYFLH